VGPLTALVYELVVGTPERFPCGKQLASYIGLVPTEESSGDRRRLGHISKQGNVLLRFLLVEAAQVTVGSQQQVFPSGYAARAEDRESRDGAKAGRPSVLDVAPGLRLQPVAQARFARESADIPMVSSKSPT
jgi:transposase